MQQEIKFWQGTNFWIASFMATFGVLFGFSETQAGEVVNAGFIIGGFLFALREKIKTIGIGWVMWIKSPNTRHYLFVAISWAIPQIPADFFVQVNNLIAAIAGRNWSGLISSLVGIGTILYFLLKPKTTLKA